MTYYFVAVIVALALLAFGETLKNETKDEYVERGYSWSKVLIYSNLFAIIGGISSIWVINYTGLGKEWNPSLIVFGSTISSYITLQSFMTDLRILKINRKILRVSYLTMYGLSLYNVITVEEFRQNWIALLVFTLLLIGIFIFSSIGASDVRAIAVGMPFVISMGGFTGIQMFTVTLLLVALGMGIRNVIRDRARMKKFKADNIESYNKMNKLAFYELARKMIRQEKTEAELATPVGPYMITPFLIYLIIFPFLLN